ncbi:hypothetical protein [Phaeacidiphilus oryzae]|uniref:hypothetical protein n=1 Tax=Phaeacidiphilus oryzae TaxID=348818 RepID=UPI00389ADBC7
MDSPLAPEHTVGELIDQLPAFDRDTRVRLAINPLSPMAHRLGGVLGSTDERGDPVVYVAESEAAEQFGYLPPDVAVALAWQPPSDPPPRRRRAALPDGP